MRTAALFALIAMVITCGPDPNATLPGEFRSSGSGGDMVLGTGGQTARGGASGGVGGTSSGRGGTTTTGGSGGAGGVASEGGAPGAGGSTVSTSTAPKASCSDRIKNQDETDIDCGGPTCVTRCLSGARCLVSTDCATATPAMVCDPTTSKCVNPCKDQKKDGDETGIDCGGSCPLKCTGDPCKASAECQSLDCDASAGTCKEATHPLANIKQTCWDGITGVNASDKTTAKNKIVPCMITNACCKLPVSSCNEACFAGLDGICGVNKTGVDNAQHTFIATYYQKCVP